MKTKEIKESLKKAIAYDLDFALNWMENWVTNSSESYNEVLVHKSNYQSIKSDLRKKFINREAADQSLTALRYRLLEWVDDIEEDELNPAFDPTRYLTQLQEKQKQTPISEEQEVGSRKYIFATLGLILLGGLLWFGFLKGSAEKPNIVNTETFDLDVFVYGDSSKSQIITDGEIRFVYDGKPENLSIGNNGRIVLSNLLNGLRKQKIKINPKVKDFQTTQIELFIPETGNVLDIILQPTQYQTYLTGNVSYLNGKPIVGAIVNIDGVEISTDQRGDFKKMLPIKPGKEMRVRVFKNQKIIYNGMERISDQLLQLTID